MAPDTRSRILDTALRLFNERGLHEVGVRDIARALSISPGNLAYHFPQKDVLVAALVQQLHGGNTQQARGPEGGAVTLVALYGSLMGIMRNHLAYRFYQLSYADILRHSEELRKNEAALGEKRRARTQRALDALVEAGYLDGARLEGRMDRLHEQLTVMMTSWLRAATVYMPDASDEEAVRHYAKLALALFEPYCTPPAEREMREILAGLYDADPLMIYY